MAIVASSGVHAGESEDNPAREKPGSDYDFWEERPFFYVMSGSSQSAFCLLSIGTVREPVL